MPVGKIILSSIALLMCSHALAEQLKYLSAAVEDNIYTMEIRVQINASVKQVWPLIADYTLLPLINDAILAATLLPSKDPDLQRVQLKTRTCIWFYCKHFGHVQDVIQLGAHDLLAIIVPPLSDFRAGWARWTLRQSDVMAQSILEVKMVLVPNFWVPPVIGPFLIKRKLANEGLESAQGLERLAKTRSP